MGGKGLVGFLSWRRRRSCTDRDLHDTGRSSSCSGFDMSALSLARFSLALAGSAWYAWALGAIIPSLLSQQKGGVPCGIPPWLPGGVCDWSGAHMDAFASMGVFTLGPICASAGALSWRRRPHFCPFRPFSLVPSGPGTSLRWWRGRVALESNHGGIRSLPVLCG